MSEFNIISDVAEVPKVTRESRGSKYDAVFPAATESATGIVAIPFKDDKTAQSRTNYMRRLAPEGFEVEQRGDEVYVTDLKVAAAATADA